MNESTKQELLKEYVDQGCSLRVGYLVLTDNEIHNSFGNSSNIVCATNMDAFEKFCQMLNILD